MNSVVDLVGDEDEDEEVDVEVDVEVDMGVDVDCQREIWQRPTTERGTTYERRSRLSRGRETEDEKRQFKAACGVTQRELVSEETLLGT